MYSLSSIFFLRINSRRLSDKTGLSKRASVRSDDWSGMFDSPPRRLQEAQGSGLASSSIKRSYSFSTPYCLSTPRSCPSIYSNISPVTNLATPASLATYPVVTPSATSFAKPSPVSSKFSSMFPAPAHSNYCTAGRTTGQQVNPPVSKL